MPTEGGVRIRGGVGGEGGGRIGKGREVRAMLWIKKSRKWRQYGEITESVKTADNQGQLCIAPTRVGTRALSKVRCKDGMSMSSIALPADSAGMA